MTAEELRRQVCSLPGVASAEVTARAGSPPLVRVWTDGTRPDAAVRSAVLALATGSGDRPVSGDASTRRTGLGRSPGETTAAALVEPVTSHLVVDTDRADGTGRFVKLAIEETGDSVEIRAIDDGGREAGATVASGAGGVSNAVATAVARLRGFPVPRSVAVNTREVDGTTVATVLVEMPSGVKAAGAAIVTGGLPFTVGRAVDNALNGLQ